MENSLPLLYFTYHWVFLSSSSKEVCVCVCVSVCVCVCGGGGHCSHSIENQLSLSAAQPNLTCVTCWTLNSISEN